MVKKKYQNQKMVIIFKYSIRRIKKPFLLDAIRKSIQFKKTEKGTRKCNKVQYRMMMKYQRFSMKKDQVKELFSQVSCNFELYQQMSYIKCDVDINNIQYRMDELKKGLEAKFNKVVTQICRKYPKLQKQLFQLKNMFNLSILPGCQSKSLTTNISQIQQLSLELKNNLKSLSKKYEGERKLFDSYKITQKLCSVIQDQDHPKYDRKQKLPQFFQNLHATSADMRLSMLEQIKFQTEKRQKIQEDYKNLYITMRQALLRKDNKIAELQEQITLLEEKVNIQLHEPANQLILQNNKLREKIIKQEISLQGIGQKERDYIYTIQQLQKQLDKEKKENLYNRQVIRENDMKNLGKHEAQKVEQEAISNEKIQQMINTAVEEATSRELSKLNRESNSKQKNKSYTMENVLQGFSQIPNQRNLTSLENTFSQQYSERKVRSNLEANTKNKYPIGEQLWRFLYVQAHSIEEILMEGNSGNSYQL